MCTWLVSTIYTLTLNLPELVPVRHGHPRPPESPRPARRGAAESQIRRQSTGTRSGDLRPSEAYALPIQGYHLDLSTGACGAVLRSWFSLTRNVDVKGLRCCCAKGVGHRAQLMLRARRGARETDYPVPLLRTSTPQKLSLSCPHSEHRGGSQLPSLSTSCHVADRERISSCSARRVAKAKVLPEPPAREC